MAPTTQEPEFENLPLRLAWPFLEANGLATEAAEIRTSPERLGSYTTTLRRAKLVASLRRKDLLDRFIETNWEFALTLEGRKKLNHYDQGLFKVRGVWCWWNAQRQHHDRRRDRSWDEDEVNFATANSERVRSASRASSPRGRVFARKFILLAESPQLPLLRRRRLR